MNDSSIEQTIEKRQSLLYPNLTTYYKTPLKLKRAKGVRVWDVSGEEYLDAIGGIVSISVGHNHPRIVDKLKSMLDENEIQHTTSLYFNLYLEELAERIKNLAPGELSKCYFTNSGSEANEMAILTARVSTGEQMVVALKHGYHGGTGVPLALCGHSNWKFPATPQPSIVHAEAPYCYRCPFKKKPESCSLECAENIKETILTTTHGKIAGMIIEPMQGVGGFISPPLEYHKRAYEIVKEFGGKYISDEVQTGVGRTGKHFFAIEESGVQPDMITMAKGIGNGAPLGGVIAKPELADSLTGKLHFNTFGGNPFSSMQASEVVDIIREENLIENAATQGKKIKNALTELQKDFPVIGDVRGRGLLVGMEFVKDQNTKDYATSYTAEFVDRAKTEGLLLGKGGLYGNIIRIAPSMAITDSETNELIDKLKRTFESMRTVEADFLS
jgi:4-aminobutyrate aminotransferase-like enzyme